MGNPVRSGSLHRTIDVAATVRALMMGLWTPFFTIFGGRPVLRSIVAPNGAKLRWSEGREAD